MGPKTSVDSLAPKASPSPTPASAQRDQDQSGRRQSRQSSSVARKAKSAPPRSVVA